MTTAQNPTHTIQEQLGSHISVTLDYPIKNGMGETVSVIKMRRARVGDMRAVGSLKNEVEQELGLFARLTGLVPEDLDLLDWQDYQKLQRSFRQLSGQKDQDGE